MKELCKKLLSSIQKNVNKRYWGWKSKKSMLNIIRRIGKFFVGLRVKKDDEAKGDKVECFSYESTSNRVKLFLHCNDKPSLEKMFVKVIKCRKIW